MRPKQKHTGINRMSGNQRSLKNHALTAGLALLLAGMPLACTRSATVLVSLSSKKNTPQLPEMGDISKQTPEDVKKKSEGCVSCHIEMDTKTMHSSSAVSIGCTDCHGGNSSVKAPGGALQGSPAYETVKNQAHILPKNKKIFTSSANPSDGVHYANDESWEFIRFINPGDLRVADLACGTAGCHVEEVSNVRKSMMSHGAHLWSAALYNNGAFPLKRAHFGESYARDGTPQRLQTVPPPTEEEMRTKGVVPFLNPLPRWEVGQPSNILRVFERGGRKPPDGIAIISQHSLPGGGFVGFEHDDEPGRAVLQRLSQRGYGTLNRTDPVWLNLQKTRLLDPTLNHFGTNDKPGDYRSSGCTACHTIYANDRDPKHSGPYADKGNMGFSHQKDPTIPKNESGHPISHVYTRAIPSSQCVVCHMHPGTSVTQAYYGYMWWDNEMHADLLYPKTEVKVTPQMELEKLNFNPEGATVRGLWGEVDFLADMSSLNEQMKTRLNPTEFADFHGHGWIFRAVYKQDKKGNLLDKEGKVIPADDPERMTKAVHMQDIHLEKGMHCIDCHFLQDNHGNGKLYGAMRNAVEIDCRDCHGTVSQRPTLKTTGPAAPEGGTDLSKLKTPFGKSRFQKRGKKLLQRSNVVEGLEWEVVQTVDTVTPGHPNYNEKSALAKTIQKDGKVWGDPFADKGKLAHPDNDMNCYTCHTSWMTSCFGCHLPMKANMRRPMLHNESTMTRNWTSYSFQTLREDVFMLGRDDTVMGGRVTTTRSACAVYVGSQNANREWVYGQQQTVSSEGFSGQAFAPSYAHTIRGKGESRLCTDCHISKENDNNAVMAMVLMQGTNAYNFYGRYVYTANGSSGVTAVMVGERDEPQAVIGSTLHKWAYPDRYSKHTSAGKELKVGYTHGAGGPFNFLDSGEILSVQHRGEYLYCASGARGLQIFDVANIDNKAFSQRITSAPVSTMGQYLWVDTKYATYVASPTTMGVDPTRERFKDNEEGPIHLLYAFLYVCDREEGLILVGAATLLDGDPNNNAVERAVTFNEGGKLTGARYVTIHGTYAYVLTDKALVVVDLNDPLNPKISSELAISDPRSIATQFRYAWVATGEGMVALDCTDMGKPKLVSGGKLAIDGGANSIYVVRTYAYVAAGAKGFAIVDVEKPEQPKLIEYFNGKGQLKDTRDVKVGITNASYFAYVADGSNGFHVVQLTSPDSTPGALGFAVKPTPVHISHFKTDGPCLNVEEGIDRDRAVDESGNQLAVFGRIGSRPFTKAEMDKMYLRDGQVWSVTDDAPGQAEDKVTEEYVQKALGEYRKPRGKRRKKRRRSSKSSSSSSKASDSGETKPKKRTRRRRKRPGASTEETPKEEPKTEPKAEPKEESSSGGRRRRRRRRGGSSDETPKAEPKSEPAEKPAEEPKAEPKEESSSGGRRRRRRRRPSSSDDAPAEKSAEEPKAEPAEKPAEEPKEEPKPEPKEEPKEEPKDEPKTEPKEEPKSDDPPPRRRRRRRN